MVGGNPPKFCLPRNHDPRLGLGPPKLPGVENPTHQTPSLRGAVVFCQKQSQVVSYKETTHGMHIIQIVKQTLVLRGRIDSQSPAGGILYLGTFVWRSDGTKEGEGTLGFDEHTHIHFCKALSRASAERSNNILKVRLYETPIKDLYIDASYCPVHSTHTPQHDLMQNGFKMCKLLYFE